jgi:hypothetical protein
MLAPTDSAELVGGRLPGVEPALELLVNGSFDGEPGAPLGTLGQLFRLFGLPPSLLAEVVEPPLADRTFGSLAAGGLEAEEVGISTVGALAHGLASIGGAESLGPVRTTYAP